MRESVPPQMGNAGATVSFHGWVNEIHKEENSFSLRNWDGVRRVLMANASPGAIKVFKSLNEEDVVTVEARPEPGDTRCDVLLCVKLTAVNRARGIPFTARTYPTVSANLKAKYRYLAFRNPECLEILRLRHSLVRGLACFLDQQGYISVETPLLAKPSSSGAKEYAVSGESIGDIRYVLPQSPQIYGQLLAMGGVEAYYQFSRCFRDENLRANRQPEFTQLQIERAFLAEEEFFPLAQGAIEYALKNAGIAVAAQFVSALYDDVVKTFRTDKPDMRYAADLSLLPYQLEEPGRPPANLISLALPKVTNVNADECERIAQTARKFNFRYEGRMEQRPDKHKYAPQLVSREKMEALLLSSAAWNGFPCTIWSGSWKDAWKLRGVVYDTLLGKPLSANSLRFVWISRYPLVERDIYNKGRLVSCNHPFVAPADIQKLFSARTHNDFLKLRSLSFDLVLNGEEIASGSTINCRPDVQEKILNILGMNRKSMARQYGYLLKAQQFGAPPVIGMGLGIDRFVSIVCDKQKIRDVIAFPKTKQGQCPVLS